MSMDYIRRANGVPAKRGALVQFINAAKVERGHIVGSRGQYLRIRWSESGKTHTHHPTWRLVYLDSPNTEAKGPRSGPA